MEVFGTTLMVISSVESRWFSNYYLLERMLTISSDIEGVIKGESLKLDEKYREQFIKEFTLGIDEIEIIKFFVDNIKKMLQKSELLSSETLERFLIQFHLLEC